MFDDPNSEKVVKGDAEGTLMSIIRDPIIAFVGNHPLSADKPYDRYHMINLRIAGLYTFQTLIFVVPS